MNLSLKGDIVHFQFRQYLKAFCKKQFYYIRAMEWGGGERERERRRGERRERERERRERERERERESKER